MLHVLHRGDEDIFPSTSILNIHTAFREMCSCWREHFIKCAAAHFHTKSVQNQFEVDHELQLPIYPCRSCRKSKSVFLYISLSFLQQYFHLLSFVFDKNGFAFVSLCLKSSGTHPNNPSHDRCKATVEHFWIMGVSQDYLSSSQSGKYSIDYSDDAVLFLSNPLHTSLWSLMYTFPDTKRFANQNITDTHRHLDSISSTHIHNISRKLNQKRFKSSSYYEWQTYF